MKRTARFHDSEYFAQKNISILLAQNLLGARLPGYAIFFDCKIPPHHKLAHVLGNFI